MTCNEIISNIVVPILSAIIGGALTLFGVWLTIHRDKKRDEENLKKSAKPWIFSIDSSYDYSNETSNKIEMSTVHNSANNSYERCIGIKNTDNGIGIVDKLTTANKTYIPETYNIFEKDTVTVISVYFEEGDSLKDIELHVNDVYGNSYVYTVILDSDIDGLQIKEKDIQKSKKCKRG